MRKIIVIGGGASGLMAAVTAARNGAQVTILEASEKPGKKLLITGNGRCNLTNTDFDREDIYRSSSKQSMLPVLEQFSEKDTISFFHDIGLLTQVKNKGCYPVTEQSSSVLDVLLREADRCRVKVKCTEKVSALKRIGDQWKVDTATWSYTCDRVILACGSQSYPATGSDGSGYAIAKKLHIQVIEPMPALVPLLVEEKFVKKLAGIRTRARVSLEIVENNKVQKTYTETGEVQWTDYGVSGIVIFQLSRYANDALRRKQKAKLFIELLPQLAFEDLYNFLCGQMKGRKVSDVLLGVLPKKMIPVMLEQSHMCMDTKCSEIKECHIRILTEHIKNIQLSVKGSKGFDMAQVCAGGIALDEINLKTMEVKKHPGLYVTGELLDVDGICGGYNLQWAWSSGYAAAMASTEQI